MKRLFAAAAVVILSSPLLSVVVSQGADSVTKPIKGSWSGTDYVVGPCPSEEFPEGAFQDVNIGKGVSSHGGESHFVSVSCNYFTSETTTEGYGWTIVTGANGDQLHLRITSTLDLETGEFIEHEWIVGGTGNSMNASGEIVTTGTVVFPTAPNPFPYGSEDIVPNVWVEPTFWVGTTEGSITLEK